MKSNIRRAAAHTGLFCALLTLLWLLLALSACIPNEALYDNYESSALSYGQSEPFHFHNGDRWNAIADNYADAILLNLAWHMGNDASPLIAAVDTDYFNGGELGQNAGLYLSVTEGISPNTDYTRYWHGGAMFVRLLHLVTDVRGIRTIGFLGVLLLAALTMILLGKKGHSDIAVCLALSLAAVQVWNLRLSLEYQTPFLIAFALCPAYLLLERRGDHWLTRLSTAGGVLVAFFDFLTAETLTLLLPLILVIAVRAKEGRLAPFKKSLSLIFVCGLCWGAAYGGSFLVKWAAASLVTGENAFALALDSAALRVSAAVIPGESASGGLFSPIAANLTMLFGGTDRVQPLRVMAGLGGTLGILGSVWYLFPAKQPEREASLLMLMLGSVVFLRFLLLHNHSFLHEFFTYRALASTILAVLMALRLNLSLPSKKKVRR